MRAIELKSALGADDVQCGNFQAVTGIATEKRRRRQERFSVDHKSPSDGLQQRLRGAVNDRLGIDPGELLARNWTYSRLFGQVLCVRCSMRIGDYAS
jgi:hypothetical protein